MLYGKLMRGFFMEADGGASGAGEPADPPAADPMQEEAQGGQEPEKKEKTYTESEAQAMIDGALSRKLKGMPSKEEAAEFRKWKAERQTAEENAAEALAATEARQKEIEARERELDAKIAAQAAGIKAEHIGDAVVLAMARVSDDVTLEAAMKDIAGKNPAWLAGAALPNAGGNPPGNAKTSYEARLAEAREKKDNVQAIAIKQEAAKNGVYLQ